MAVDVDWVVFLTEGLYFGLSCPVCWMQVHCMGVVGARRVLLLKLLQLRVLLGEEGPSPALLMWLRQPGPLQ